MKKLILGLVLVMMLTEIAAAQACTVRTYFSSPTEYSDIRAIIIQAIDNAKLSLDIALRSFTDDQLGDAVVRAAQRGVSVRVILGSGQDRVPGGEYAKLTAADVDVIIIGTRELLNHRFAVIDGRTVITGSYDWTDYPKESVYDHVSFISCSDTARGFTAQFYRIWRGLAVERGPIAGEPAPLSEAEQVIIHSVDPAGKCINLINISSAPVDISGWSLSDLEGSYIFPTDTIISPDEPYEVCIDTYNPTYDPQGLFLNDDHDEVLLITPDGKIIDERIWGD
jgi:hypothetical protein